MDQKKEIRNLVFDLGVVLVDLDKQRCVEAFRQIGAADIAYYVEHHLTEDLFFDVEVGRITTAQFCDEVRRRACCTATDEQIVWAWNQLLTGIATEKIDRLEALSRRYRLFLLSNTNEMHWLKCARDFFPCRDLTADTLFERIFLSYEMGLAKPDAAIFQTVLDVAALNPAETLFIDDNQSNCATARQLGISTFHETTGRDWLEQLPAARLQAVQR